MIEFEGPPQDTGISMDYVLQWSDTADGIELIIGHDRSLVLNRKMAQHLAVSILTMCGQQDPQEPQR